MFVFFPKTKHIRAHVRSISPRLRPAETWDCRQPRCESLTSLEARAVNETKWLPLLSHRWQFGRGFPGNANLVCHRGRAETVLLQSNSNSLGFVFPSALRSVSAGASRSNAETPMIPSRNVSCQTGATKQTRFWPEHRHYGEGTGWAPSLFIHPGTGFFDEAVSF